MGPQELTGPRSVSVVHDVVAVEDAARLVAAYFHRDALGNAGPQHVPGGRSAQIVNDDSRQSRLLAGRFPGFSKIADRLTVVVRDERTLK